MVDELIVESINYSIGKIIIFWDLAGRRFEGKVLATSEEFMKYFDLHRNCERFVKFSDIREAEIK